MFVGVELRHSEARWATMYNGQFCAFPLRLCPGDLNKLFSDWQDCDAFFRELIDEISRQAGQTIRSFDLCVPALDVREYAILKASLAAVGNEWARVLNPAASAALASCYQNAQTTDRMVVIAADKDRYNLCIAQNGDGVCEILTSVPLRKPDLSNDDILGSVYKMCEVCGSFREPVKPERIMAARGVSDACFSLIRDRLRLPSKRFDDDLGLLGATVSAGISTGDIRKFLLLDAFEYRIKLRSDTLLSPDLTFPVENALPVPAAAVRNQQIGLSLASDDISAPAVFVSLPVPPSLWPAEGGNALTLRAMLDRRCNISFLLSGQNGQNVRYEWPEIREQICRETRISWAAAVKKKAFASGSETLEKKEKPAEPLRAPEDDGPFLFISYAHKNKARILPIIHRLQQDGYRVWYDNDIHPGTEWPEIIASRVEQCAVFLPFMTKEYMLSENCKRELHYAGDQNKTRTLVFLEQVELTSGMKLQHGLQQAILAFSFSDPEELFRRLYEAEGVAAARK